MKVFVKEYDHKVEGETDIKIFSAEEFHIHPDIVDGFYGGSNNIAVLKINGSIDVKDPKSNPICLPTNNLTKTEGYFAGYKWNKSKFSVYLIVILLEKAKKHYFG